MLKWARGYLINSRTRWAVLAPYSTALGVKFLAKIIGNQTGSRQKLSDAGRVFYFLFYFLRFVFASKVEQNVILETQGMIYRLKCYTLTYFNTDLEKSSKIDY